MHNVLNVLRAGLYERVSTDEQALHGYSIITQKDTLEEYCQEKGYKIVGHYTDEGISGAKPPLKRPALKQLLDDVQAGKIDVIVFTKLDRWFRSIEQYYKVQEILEKHNVPWQAVLEDYNTATADGRLKVNIMLSVAANERERTSERIKVVFERRIKNKEAAFGGCSVTMGYMRQKDENGISRIVKDPETQHITEEYWDMLMKYNNVMKVARHLNNKYNLKHSHTMWNRLKDKEIYTGEYRGVKEFCEPYISREDWLMIQSRPNIKRAQNNKIYLFTGLIKCPTCGNNLVSYYTARNGVVKYKGYRCKKSVLGLCEFKESISERKLEKKLLDNLEQLITEKIQAIEIQKAKPKKKPKTDVANLKEQLRKLNVMYMAGGKTDEEYIQETAEIKALIDKARLETSQVERDFTPLKELLKTDYKTLYDGMTEEDKRRFWRSIIKEIHLEGKEIKEVIFLIE